MTELVAKLPTQAQDLELAKPGDRVELVRQTLSANSTYIGQALGKFMNAERFNRMVVTLVRGSDALLKCQPSSVVLSVLRIAQLQLSPDPSLGQAWLIPRKGKAVFQIGYKGYLALAYRSRRVLAVRYGAVHKIDKFEWRDGRHFVLDHVPGDQGWPAQQGDLVAAWAVIDLRGGGQVPRVMYLPEILRHKSRGEGSQPAWTTDFAAQAVKTVIGDVCRRGPLEEEFGRALSWDEGEQPEDPEIKDVKPTPIDTSSKAGAFVAAFTEPSVQGDDPFDGALGRDGEVLGVDSPVVDEIFDGATRMIVAVSSVLDDCEVHGDAAETIRHEMTVPPHVARILSAARGRGIDAETLRALATGPVDATLPADLELTIMREIRAWKSPESKRK
jgi:recombination protein RecT